ncbi:hypothetical protein BDN72DRAFT_847448, partial [Pluteus cervinus]
MSLIPPSSSLTGTRYTLYPRRPRTDSSIHEHCYGIPSKRMNRPPASFNPYITQSCVVRLSHPRSPIHKINSNCSPPSPRGLRHHRTRTRTSYERKEREASNAHQNPQPTYNYDAPPIHFPQHGAREGRHPQISRFISKVPSNCHPFESGSRPRV